MKKYILLSLVSVLVFSNPLFASNYYWVGGTGTWSDYATHWATSSGGTVFHVTIPSPSDDVFFDANSFPGAGDTIYLDTTITNCKTMDWTGATNTPTIFCPEFSHISLNIYGSFLLTPGMNWNAGGALNLRSSAPVSVINTAGVTLSGGAPWDEINLSFMNNTTWDLRSPLIVQPAYQGDIHLLKGIFFTHGYPISCENFTLDSATLFLDTSLITCDQWTASNQVIQLDADSAFMNCNNMYGGVNQVYRNVSGYGISGDSCVFNDVQCEHISTHASSYHNVNMVSTYNYINGTGNTFTSCIISAATCNLSGAINTFDTLIFSTPGQQVQIANGATINVNGLLAADGSCGGLTAITSAGTGIINKTSGSVNLNYVLLQNITATGGAVFTANNSIDGGNVTGFIINAPAPQNLYWVGGTGNWSDVNHWSVSSGGAGGSCVPTQYDDVFFDANSFPSANDSVYLDFPIIYCKNMDWTGAMNTPIMFSHEFSNTVINIYGSFLLTPGMSWNAGGALNLRSSAPASVINTAGVTLSGGAPWDEINLSFMNNTTWDLRSPLIVQPAYQGDIHLLKGIFFTHGYPISCENFTLDSATLFLDTSLITCDQWTASNQVIQLDADSAFMNCNNMYGGVNQVYRNVSGYGISGDSCVFNDVQCEHISTHASSYHNVNMVSTYNYINGTGNTFTSCIISAATCNLSGAINTFDTLIFSTPGQQVQIANGATINVNGLLAADGSCGGLTAITSAGTGIINKTSGSVNLNYVLLQNITATGGAVFTANNSIDGGNVTGFIINAPAPQNLYWVGGTGNWSDVNHWSVSSGGAGGSCVPTQYDDVFFDANSFPSANDSVYLDFPIIYCKNMDWTGATNTPMMFSHEFSNTVINIYGSFLLTPGMSWNAGGALNFRSSAPASVINTAGITLSGGASWDEINLSFMNNTTWDLQSPLIVQPAYQGDIHLLKGIFFTHGYPISCENFTLDSATLFLDTSLITCDQWTASNQVIQLDADSAFMNCNNMYGGVNQVYRNVSGYGISGDSCVFNDVQCEHISTHASSYHNVNMVSSYNYINGTGNTFTSCIISAATCNLSGAINTFDTLMFNNPGQQIEITNNAMLQVNDFLLIQSNPGFPTSIECNSGTAIISKPTDTVCADFIYLKNITATGGAIYFAGDHGVDLGGNTGWNWVRCAPLISNVWPGDCNYDLVTDNFDLLNIGVSFGDTGYVRPSASLNYIAQPCQDWYYQFINAANVKHADCDGNGIVDANDSTAIGLNYGLTHPARLAHQDENNSTGTELSFVLPPVLVPGSSVTVPVTLGTSVDPANAVYGIAFSVIYDPAFIQPGTMTVDYASSWVENAGNHLHLEKDFPGAGKTDIAFTRIDHSDASGFGIIATLNFVASSTANGPFNLSFSHVKVISHNEIEIPIQTSTSTTWVNIGEAGNEIASTVFPNPMTDEAQVIFSNPNHETWYFSMKDVTGRVTIPQQLTSGNSFSVERKNLNSGVYFYALKNEKGNSGFGKIIIE